MKFTGLPAARTVEQAILLAQAQILRKMEREKSAGVVLNPPDVTVASREGIAFIRGWVDAGQNEGTDE